MTIERAASQMLSGIAAPYIPKSLCAAFAVSADVSGNPARVRSFEGDRRLEPTVAA